jgi:hypothetical protein
VYFLVQQYYLPIVECGLIRRIRRDLQYTSFFWPIRNVDKDLASWLVGQDYSVETQDQGNTLDEVLIGVYDGTPNYDFHPAYENRLNP